MHVYSPAHWSTISVVVLVPSWGRRLNHLQGRRPFWKNSNFWTRWLGSVIFFFKSLFGPFYYRLNPKIQKIIENPKNTGCPKNVFFQNFEKCPPNHQFLMKLVLTRICSMKRVTLIDKIEFSGKKVFLSSIQGVQKIRIFDFFWIFEFSQL